MNGHPDPAMRHWNELSPAEQAQVIREMAAYGAGEYVIAGATRLSVEMVRKILGRQRQVA